MKKLLIIVVAFTVASNICGQNNLSVDGIPEELKKGAVAVVRYDNTEVVVSDRGKALVNVEYAITILNENGKRHAYVQLPYNAYRKYSKLNIELLDASGDRVKKIKSDEIFDVSNISSASLYEDQRVIYSKPEHNIYPYTVKLSYQLTLDGLMSLPSWYMLNSYNVSSQKSDYKLLVPNGTQIRYHATNFNGEPDRSPDKEYQEYDCYYWESSNMPIIKYEGNSKNFGELVPLVLINSIEFEYGGVVGSYETWKTFGDWIWKLLDGKDEFSDEAAAEIRGLVADCKNDKEKVETLYKYMQDKVRYVNISIGLGGLEPISAQRVHDVSYGDCKALTNYMRSMLKLVGVESLYAIVKAGNSVKKIDRDFPSQQFNHVILAVPLELDTIWLECTSQRLPAGFLGDFTDDRTVLFVTEEGGILGRTPKFSMEENAVLSRTTITLDDNFTAKICRDKKFGGTYFDNVYMQYLHRDEDETKKAILSSLPLSDFTLDSYKYEYDLEGLPHICQSIEITDDEVVTKNGEYYTLPMNLVSYQPSVPTRVRSRRQEVFVRRAKSFSDTVCISIPEGYLPMEMPEAKEIVSKFGKYVSKAEETDSGIMYVREMEFYDGTFPAGEYRDFYQYYRDISKASGQMLVLVKSN